MFGDNYRIGDYVEINDEKGRIEDLTLLNVHLKNDEDNVVIIPNNQMAAAIVTNYSKNPRLFTLMDFEIRSSHSISYQRLERELFKVMEPYEEILRKDSQQLRVVEYKKDIIHYRLRFGLKKYEHPIAQEIKQLLYRELLKILEVDKIQNK
jgi:small-conductance mechanosensitive channel